VHCPHTNQSTSAQLRIIPVMAAIEDSKHDPLPTNSTDWQAFLAVLSPRDRELARVQKRFTDTFDLVYQERDQVCMPRGWVCTMNAVDVAVFQRRSL
jgi:hypothetical protein